MRRHWPYVAVTAVLAVIVAIWAIPEVSVTPRAAGGPSGELGLPTLSFATSLDAVSAQVLLLAVGVGLLVQLYSVTYLGHHPRYRSYALVIVLFLFAMIAVVATDDLFVLLIGWEVMGLCSYLLIGHEWQTAEARSGAAKAFLMTRTADLALVLAILVIGQTYGSYRIGEVLSAASAGAENETAIGLLLLVAVIGKSAQFPLHTWLPDAMPGPTPITALIHAATMVAAGIYLMVRLSGLFAGSAVVMSAMAVVAAITMLLGAVLALVQADLKRALAWSTVSQLAFMFAAVAAADPDAGTAHLVAHGVFKALLFLGCGCLMHAVGSSALSAMGGLRRSMPVTFWTMTVGFAALAGVVPTVGFFTKDGVLAALQHAGEGHEAIPSAMAWTVFAIAAATTVLTAAYAMRLWLAVFWGPVAEDHAHDAPWPMSAPLVVLAVAAFALSVGQPGHLDMGMLSTGLAIIGGGAVLALWRRRGSLVPQRPVFAAEFVLDRPYARWIPAAVGAAARAVVDIDRDGVDAYPRAGAVGASAASAALGEAQSRNVQLYATVIAVGVVALVLAAVVIA